MTRRRYDFRNTTHHFLNFRQIIYLRIYTWLLEKISIKYQVTLSTTIFILLILNLIKHEVLLMFLNMRFPRENLYQEPLTHLKKSLTPVPVNSVFGIIFRILYFFYVKFVWSLSCVQDFILLLC